MLDVRNRELAEVTQRRRLHRQRQADQPALAQVSENKELNAVFDDLFDPDGSEIYSKPPPTTSRLDAEVNFSTVVESARRRGRGRHRLLDRQRAEATASRSTRPSRPA